MSVTDELHEDKEHVGERARRGLSWNLVGAISTNALRLIVVAVLGRALTPDDFGVVAAAISVNVLFYSIRDLGVGQALVQLRTIANDHVQTSFAVSTLLGVTLSTLLAVFAQPIANAYRIGDYPNVIRVIGLLFVIRGVSITSRVMCQRAMDFRVIALTDTTTFCIGSITSMVLAVAGAGPWALVTGYLVEELGATLVFLWKSPPPFSLRIRRECLRDLMRFGTAHTFSQIAATLAIYGDNFVIGNALGARMLGYYSRAYDLIRFPSAVFDSIVGSVLFPTFAKLQGQSERLADGFRRAMFTNAVVLMPASTALYIVAPETIEVLMGRNWNSAVQPFRILVLTMMMRVSAKVGQMVASAAGGIRGVAIANTIYMGLVIGGALFTIRWGIDGVAVSTAIAIFSAFVGFSYLGIRITGLSARALVVAHVGGVVLSLAAGSVCWLVVTMLRNAGVPAAGVFAAGAISSILAALLVGGMALKQAWGDFGWLRSELVRFRQRT